MDDRLPRFEDRLRQIDEAFEALCARVAALEGAQRFLVLAVDLDRARVPLEGARGVPDALLVQRCDAMQELDALERILRHARLHAESAHQLLPLGHRVVHGLERLGCQ